MSFAEKLALVVVLLAAAVVLSRWVPSHPRWRPLVIMLNLVVSIRYLWWRGTETLNWESGAGIAISLTVYMAEIYGFLVVLHHYLIATRTTDRKAPPPEAAAPAPPVDVFITTYNEDTGILYRTIVGCQAMDYPDKRIHVLDDGRRPEVAKLCQRLGAGYITRDDRAGAKAGNLNNGLSRTGAPLVVTLDADHVPVRTFLSETVSFFQDEKVAQVQTPHHFYNPDLFQDRLRIREFIANEQDMFYHVVQPGRDVYNSSFYCGSGAVFRRAALEGIGGFPVDTVTEDLHTSVLLHSRGWRSVYVNRDLSAGLAPESYAAYLTQRRRWARGTFQVMLQQGGLFRRGLSFMQRLNYLATLWYWLYGLPRVVYLLAPLFFLLGGLRPLIIGDLSDLLTFYLPHLAISIVSFQLINLGMRRIFWSDVYESCISVQVALTSLIAPFSLKRVAFEVTPKGEAADREQASLAWRLGWPLGLLSGLAAAGLVVGVINLYFGTTERDGTLINTVWAAYNLVVLGFGLALLRHRPQRRSAVRLPRRSACLIAWNGHRAEGETLDLSETGMSFRLSPPQALPDHLEVTLTDGGPPLKLWGRLVRCEVSDPDSCEAAVDFVERSDEQHRELVQRMFSAPDSWAGPHGLVMGAPEHLGRILKAILSLFSAPMLLRRLAPRFRCDLPGTLLVGGRPMAARIIDVGLRGVAVRLGRGEGVPSPESFRVTVAWNQMERTTVNVRVRNVRRGAGGDTILGLRFDSLLPEQRNDLIKHLYRNSGAAQVAGVAS